MNREHINEPLWGLPLMRWHLLTTDRPFSYTTTREKDNPMFERFTDRARKVMQLAQQEAQRFNLDFVGTEHVLIGLMKEGAGVAANVLNSFGIDLNKLRVKAESGAIPRWIRPDVPTKEEGPSGLNKPPYTPMVNKLVKYAGDEARTLQHGYVGTEHILLGLLRCDEDDRHPTPGLVILKACGVTLEAVRQEVMRLLGHEADATNKVDVPTILGGDVEVDLDKVREEVDKMMQRPSTIPHLLPLAPYTIPYGNGRDATPDVYIKLVNGALNIITLQRTDTRSVVDPTLLKAAEKFLIEAFGGEKGS